MNKAREDLLGLMEPDQASRVRAIYHELDLMNSMNHSDPYINARAYTLLKTQYEKLQAENKYVLEVNNNLLETLRKKHQNDPACMGHEDYVAVPHWAWHEYDYARKFVGFYRTWIIVMSCMCTALATIILRGGL